MGRWIETLFRQHVEQQDERRADSSSTLHNKTRAELIAVLKMADQTNALDLHYFLARDEKA